jgi:hypothetical protein
MLSLVAAEDCDRIYTSGYNPTPGSPNAADWRWHVTPYHSQPLTYTHWADGEPDNLNDKGQDVIALIPRFDYNWHDVIRSAVMNKQFCHVCECNTCP